MKTGSFAIEGGDYDRAGSASGALKELLKKVGADPDAVRRASIAAYEAEMNVVIHARRGAMRFRLNPARLELDVEDEGPGIPDIPRAMQEGYSTAPESARRLGFGAGMGLPNIRRNSNTFSIASTVGQGTRVRIGIVFAPEAPGEAGAPLSLRVRPGACRQCLQCLFGCPTRALRVRGGRPCITAPLCIECASCMAVCPAKALEVEGSDAMPDVPAGAVLVAPPALFAQFGAGVPLPSIKAALGRLGFARIVCLEPWEEALRQAVRGTAADAARRPVLSPCCPAVVNLVEMRFPSLIPHLAPFAAPLEAARDTLAGEPLVLAVSCPGQRSALLAGPRPAPARVVVADALIRALRPLLKPQPAEDARRAAPRRETVLPAPPADVVAVTGLRDVMQTLEEVEGGQLGDVPALELALCEQGCFGSPLYRESAPIARHRWAGGPLDEAAPGARAVRRRAPYLPRTGVRLDPDMSRAIAKLGELEALARRLPGRDCGACGAPSCVALAEDIVLGRATLAFCVHQPRA